MTQSPPEILESVFEVRIPKARIAVVIGQSGKTKRMLESDTNTKIDIDSQEGEVTVTSNDAVQGFIAKDIVRAIGRGFNPEFAKLLLKPDYAFELVDLSEFSNQKHGLERVKGRLIGREGKTRTIIENLMEVHISIFGKTIGLIGEVERVNLAAQAVDMLLEGSPHANVYKWLENKRKSIIKSELSGSNKVDIKEEYQKYVN